MTVEGAARSYLEDMQVGWRFSSGTHAIDQAQIIEFAARFDPQPFHLDAEAAKRSVFGGLAASGWHTAAITMRLLVDGAFPTGDGIVGAGGELNWPNPTRPGDILRVEGEILEVRPSRSKPDRGMVVIRCETRTQNDVIVQTFVAKLMVMRRPSL